MTDALDEMQDFNPLFAFWCAIGIFIIPQRAQNNANVEIRELSSAHEGESKLAD